MTDNPSPALTTFFTVDDTTKAIDFYTEVLGAELVARFDGPDGQVAHAEMRLGDAAFQLGDASANLGLLPQPEEGNNFTMTFWTTDPDSLFARAVAAGATPITPVDDIFTGDRMGVIRDPAGIRWNLARHDRDVSPEEVAAAAEKWMAENGG